MVEFNPIAGTSIVDHRHDVRLCRFARTMHVHSDRSAELQWSGCSDQRSVQTDSDGFSGISEIFSSNFDEHISFNSLTAARTNRVVPFTVFRQLHGLSSASCYSLSLDAPCGETGFRSTPSASLFDCCSYL